MTEHKTYTELIEHFRAKGRIMVETECSVMRDFQKTVEIYADGYNHILRSGINPKDSLELRTRKATMEKWYRDWDKYKIVKL